MENTPTPPPTVVLDVRGLTTTLIEDDLSNRVVDGIDLIRAHHGIGRAAAKARAVELLTLVGIPTPDKRVHDYPHQFSGGQRQRILIAMAEVLTNPQHPYTAQLLRSMPRDVDLELRRAACSLVAPTRPSERIRWPRILTLPGAPSNR